MRRILELPPKVCSILTDCEIDEDEQNKETRNKIDEEYGRL
jgi:hypothetical protein